MIPRILFTSSSLWEGYDNTSDHAITMTPPSHTRTAGSRKSKIYVLPTRYGYTFIFVLTAMLLGSVNYNNNLGFLLTFLLGGMVMVSIFHTCRNIAGIRILSVQAQPVFAGENAVFECRVRADRFPAAAIGLSFAENRRELNDVEPGSEILVRAALPTAQRGHLKPGHLTVHSRYPLGLFRAWMRIPVDTRCLVYPHPILGPVKTSTDIAAENASGPSDTRGVDDFQGLRSYQPGDSLQHISWKTFSRGQGLFTKQFSGQAGMTDMLDWEDIEEPEVEIKLSRLCGMVLSAHRGQSAYGLRLPARTIRPNHGKAHKHNCLKALALYGMS